jgi:glycosyltransferase involved in cell wall biosynthesis
MVTSLQAQRSDDDSIRLLPHRARVPVRVLVLVPGHLSTSPRLVKAADACAEAGHRVRVVSGSFMDWAAAADEDVAASRSWSWQRVEFRSSIDRAAYVRTGLRRRMARAVVHAAGAGLAPWWALTRSVSRVHDELTREALREPFDAIVGGSVGGLALVPEIAARAAKPFCLDLEDLHTAESEAPDAALQHAVADRVLRRVLRTANALTTASEPMADAYHERFGIRPAVIHNVFPLPSPSIRDARHAGPLRLYWFSQTIGPGRGIEDAVNAVAHAGIDAVLTLRGVAQEPYVSRLGAEARRSAPKLRIVIESPAAPDQMIRLCEGHDVGLSLEVPNVENRRVCLTNKLFTYLPAGLPIVMSDTPAQRWLAERLGAAAVVYESGNAKSLAPALARWAADRDALDRARAAAYGAACTRWRWDHAMERDAFLALVQRMVS